MQPPERERERDMFELYDLHKPSSTKTINPRRAVEGRRTPHRTDPPLSRLQLHGRINAQNGESDLTLGMNRLCFWSVAH